MSLAKPTTETRTNTTPSPVRFQLGRLFMTPGAIEALEDAGQSPQESLRVISLST